MRVWLVALLTLFPFSGATAAVAVETEAGARTVPLRVTNLTAVDDQGAVEFDLVNLSDRHVTAWVLRYSDVYSDGRRSVGRETYDAHNTEAKWLPPHGVVHRRLSVGQLDGQHPVATDVWPTAAAFSDGTLAGAADEQHEIISARQQERQGWVTAIRILLEVQYSAETTSLDRLRVARSRIASYAEGRSGIERAALRGALSRLDLALRTSEPPDEALVKTIAIARGRIDNLRAHLRSATE